MITRQSHTIVPKALRIWFVIHFFADIIAAIPLFIKPDILALFGWEAVDPYTTRLVAAALFGIGIESWIGRNADIHTFKNILNLKVIWSFSASLGILISILQNAQGVPPAAMAVLGIFVTFHVVWVYWRVIVGRIINRRI